jgi:hypothetical protein
VLTHADEGACYDMEMTEHFQVMIGSRICFEVSIEFIALRGADFRHRSMLKHPREGLTFGGPLPIFGGLVREKMEESVIGG